MASTPAVGPGLIFRPDLSTPNHHPRHYLSVKTLVEVVRRNRPAFLVLRPPHSRSACPLPSRAKSGAAPVPGDSSSSHTRRLTAPPDIETLDSGGGLLDGGYLGLFVRMLGLDNDPLDREQAVITLWKYSQGGKDCVDGIMKFPGCINLIVNLLKSSDSESAREAAAGLLRTISSVSMYRDSVADSGVIEEIAALLLCQSSLTLEVKEQSICVLWNLSVDERQRVKIANSHLLPRLVKFLDDEEIKLKEAAGGVLANLALSHCNHGTMVEAGVIPKLAELFKSNSEGYKVIRKVAKNALLELSKDEYQRILIMEEGLVLVPLIGSAAYKSLRPVSYSWPSLPDGTEIERTPSPSRYGARELLIGLNIPEKNINLTEAKMNALVGRSQQQFLARIGAIELEEGKRSLFESSTNEQQTLLPWMDGVARLVLILGLEDVSAISKAARAIAVASISERMRISFKEAGAVRCLVQLLGHVNEAVREAATDALEKLSVSHEVCQAIEVENVVNPLIKFLKNTNTSESLREKSVNILAQIFDPGKHMKSKFYHKVVNGSDKVLNSTSSSLEDTRGVVIDSDAISCLIEMLKASSPILQMKAASTLEYLANFEEHVTKITTSGIESGLHAVFQQSSVYDMEDDTDYEQELDAVKTEEEGLAIAAASRLLTKLLNFEKLHCTLDLKHFMVLLRNVLRSNIPLHAKDWVAACLVKIQSSAGLDMETKYPIDMEVTLYQTIPRLVEQMRASFSSESREAAVLELNGIIISKGMAECTGAVASAGGIFPLVDIIEKGCHSAAAVEASLAVLYSLSMDSENHSAIIAAGAVPVLRRIVLSEGPQWTRALHLLRTLPT